MRPKTAIIALLLLQHWLLAAADAPGFSQRLADRARVERIYHDHRTGEKPPFEQAVPQELLTQLVREDLAKESLLKSRYGVEISEAEIHTEVRRIDATTRAPEVLAEIRAALGGDPARFALTVARPIVADRLLRARFDQDAGIHSEKRRQMEELRRQVLELPLSDPGQRLALLKSRSGRGTFNEVTWLTGPRPPAQAAAPAPKPSRSSGGTYTVEATAQITAAPQSTPSQGASPTQPYLEDLPPQLQKVLLAQLRQPGDVSAVIETTTAFSLFIAQPAPSGQLRAGCLALPKHSFEQWLVEQQPAPRGGS